MDVGLGARIGLDVLVVEILLMAERCEMHLERQALMLFCLVGIGDRHNVDARTAEGHSKQTLKNVVCFPVCRSICPLVLPIFLSVSPGDHLVNGDQDIMGHLSCFSGL